MSSTGSFGLILDAARIFLFETKETAQSFSCPEMGYKTAFGTANTDVDIFIKVNLLPSLTATVYKPNFKNRMLSSLMPFPIAEIRAEISKFAFILLAM